MSPPGVFYTDTPDMSASSLFYGPDSHMRNYLSNSINQYVNVVKSTVPEFASSIVEKFNNLSNSSTLQYMSNLKNRIQSLWQTDCVRHLGNMNSLQQAPNVMRKYIMAMPELRSRYQNNALSGYDKKYVDEYPNTIGNSHYDYRRVTEGIIMQKGDYVGYTIFYENVKEEDILTIVQKNNIHSTWDTINHYLEIGDNSDPTSVWGGTL